MFFSAPSLLALVATIASSGVLPSVMAHMAMTSPCPRYGAGNGCPSPPSGESVDYNIRSPIGTHDSIQQPLCKHTTPYSQPVTTFSAGSSINLQFTPNGAAHGGGHCQFALSYDGGKTFVVIHDELKYCFTGGPGSSNGAQIDSYNIPLPKDAPSGRAILAWGWNNAVGNREFYMNCADIEVTGGGSSLSGPKMLFANYGPDSPLIPEFNGNYDTGLDLFQKRPTITVTGSGSYSGGGYSASSPPSSGSGYGSAGSGADSPLPAQGGYSASSPNLIGGSGSEHSPASPPSLPSPNSGLNYGTSSSPNSGNSGSPYFASPQGSTVASAAPPTTTTPSSPSDNYSPLPRDASTQSGTSGGSAGAPPYSVSSAAGHAVGSTGSNDTGSSCNTGEMRCTASGNSFEVCGSGRLYTIECPTGTKCRGAGSSVQCTWA